MENPLASVLHINITYLQPIIRSLISREQHEKYLYNQSSHYRNVRLLMCAPRLLIEKWVCYLNTTLCLLLIVWTCYAMFQAKSNIRSAPASSALTLVSHRSHNARTANLLYLFIIYLYWAVSPAGMLRKKRNHTLIYYNKSYIHAKEERNGVQRRTKVTLGRTMMQALKLLLWLAKKAHPGMKWCWTVKKSRL